jgi:hypothetical protein
MRRHLVIHPRNLLLHLVDQVRGREQMLVRAGEDLPLVVVSYPRGHTALAEALQTALGSTYRQLSPETRKRYEAVLPRLPSMVVVILRTRNACTCLGHHHPAGTQSRIARRLRRDTGLEVGEIDLAAKAIREWEPLPLATIAADVAVAPDAEFQEFRFHVGLLTVFLHELEHLAFPDHGEQQVRQRSNDFYTASMRELFRREFGVSYGI